MKASDLRIGNYVVEKGRSPFSISIEKICDFENGFYKFEPIDLTEEWLIKLGFKKRNERLFTLNYFAVQRVNGLFYFESYKLIPLNFIHQLQNTYFISEGVELELSSNVE